MVEHKHILVNCEWLLLGIYEIKSIQWLGNCFPASCVMPDSVPIDVYYLHNNHYAKFVRTWLYINVHNQFAWLGQGTKYHTLKRRKPRSEQFTTLKVPLMKCYVGDDEIKAPLAEYPSGGKAPKSTGDPAGVTIVSRASTPADDTTNSI
jgi:hypothetical protein